MYKTQKRLVLCLTEALLAVMLVVLMVSIFPLISGGQLPLYRLFISIFAGFAFIALSLIVFKLRRNFNERIETESLYKGETSILSDFINRLRFCYSLEDLYEAIADILEQKGDCSVLLMDTTRNYVLYNSPNRLTSKPEVVDRLNMNYPQEWDEGIFYMDDEFGIMLDPSDARGFFLSKDKHHLYVFCRYTKLFDHVIYESLFEEFSRFLVRASTISNLSEISSLSQEWQQLADTQKSFLPLEMPKINKLEVAAYFRPLVNVSGDYYSVLPIDENKTLLMLGDVSGKGLAAALVMGLVMNTVKILENKEDLPAMIRAVDKAIKGMKLQDKYTVLFLGIVDTKKMTIRYVNASMSDPLIITRAPDGYRIKPLTSNCSLVGIIDIDDVTVDEQRLFRGDVILMSSDGVSEVMDETGVELGTTELYQNTIRRSAEKMPQEFIDDVVNLVFTYNGDKKLRDDVTMMVAKVVD